MLKRVMGTGGTERMLNALQASDFVLTPLSEDQGAITHFFSGNPAQNMGEAPRLLWALIGSQISCWMCVPRNGGLE